MQQIDISDSDYKYLQSLAVPFEDTPATILSKVLEKYKEMDCELEVETPQTRMSLHENSIFSMKNLPNVSFTKIRSASISGIKCKTLNWNNILEEMIEKALHVNDFESVRKKLSLQMKKGKFTESGYRFIESLDISFQGVDAQRACKNISELAAHLGLTVEITLLWDDKPKAQFPGEEGTLRFP